MKKILFLILPLTISLLTASKFEPKVIKARDGHRQYDRSSRHNHNSGRNDILSSTSEASSEISVGISCEATSQATSHNRHSNAHIAHFLQENRIDITTDMAKGEGEYITTLLHIMNLKKDSSTLGKIQTNFDQFIDLDADDFLVKLKDISTNA
jgi:hypothetical protein